MSCWKQDNNIKFNLTLKLQILFPFSFKNVEFLADVFSCNPPALYQSKYKSFLNTEEEEKIIILFIFNIKIVVWGQLAPPQ